MTTLVTAIINYDSSFIADVSSIKKNRLPLEIWYPQGPNLVLISMTFFSWNAASTPGKKDKKQLKFCFTVEILTQDRELPLHISYNKHTNIVIVLLLKYALRINHPQLVHPQGGRKGGRGFYWKPSNSLSFSKVKKRQCSMLSFCTVVFFAFGPLKSKRDGPSSWQYHWQALDWHPSDLSSSSTNPHTCECMKYLVVTEPTLNFVPENLGHIDETKSARLRN